jgi:hypothetical protein
MKTLRLCGNKVTAKLEFYATENTLKGQWLIIYFLIYENLHTQNEVTSSKSSLKEILKAIFKQKEKKSHMKGQRSQKDQI